MEAVVLENVGKHLQGMCSGNREHYEVWGSQGGEGVDVGLLGCNAAWTCR